MFLTRVLKSLFQMSFFWDSCFGEVLSIFCFGCLLLKLTKCFVVLMHKWYPSISSCFDLTGDLSPSPLSPIWAPITDLYIQCHTGRARAFCPGRHGRMAVVPNHSPPRQPHCLLHLPPSLPPPPPQWLKLTFQREGEAGWGDESAVLRLASVTELPGSLGLLQG